MTQKQLFILSFFVLLVLIFLQLAGIFRLFLTPMLWAVILALVFYPLYLRLRRLVRGRRSLAAAMTTLIVVVLTVGPIVFFSGTLVKEVLEFYQNLADWVVDKKYEALWRRLMDSPLQMIWTRILEKTQAWDFQILPLAQRTLQTMTQAVVGQIQHGAKNIVFFILYYFVTIFIFFFFLRDGEAMVRSLKLLFPMTRENKEVVFQRLSTTVSAVVRGLVVTGAVQAALAGSAFWALGVPFPVFLALLVGFLALVPIGGAILVWLPSAIYLFFSVSWVKALILFLWGGLVISTVDNFLKPLLIGEKTKLPTLFLFLAILGGLAFYGFIGVFLGPVMLALFLTLIEIYRKEYPES